MRWLRARGRVLRGGADGAPVRAIGVWRDITAERDRDDAEEALRRQQRGFLRQVLASATGGRVRLCDGPLDLPAPPDDAQGAGGGLPLTANGLTKLRGAVRAAGAVVGMCPYRTADLVLAAGEAGMNAVVHAGGGRAWVSPDQTRGVVQVWVTDEGAGIRESDLHRATLEPGYSSAGTLGQGFSIITQAADRVWLLTGPGGTTLVLEHHARGALDT